MPVLTNRDVANRPNGDDNPGTKTETAMPEGYRHLTYADRCRIKALMASGRPDGRKEFPR